MKQYITIIITILLSLLTYILLVKFLVRVFDCTLKTLKLSCFKDYLNRLKQDLMNSLKHIRSIEEIIENTEKNIASLSYTSLILLISIIIVLVIFFFESGLVPELSSIIPQIVLYWIVALVSICAPLKFSFYASKFNNNNPFVKILLPIFHINLLCIFYNTLLSLLLSHEDSLYSIGVLSLYYISIIITNLTILFVCPKWSNSPHLLNLGVIIFVIIINYILGGIVFGLYYHSTFPDFFELQLTVLPDAQNYGLAIFDAFCIGMPYFFQFPDNSILDFPSILQFLWGKTLEILFIGYAVQILFKRYMNKET